MAEYIKREDAERALLERCKETGYGGLTPDDIRLVMRTPWRIPTAADVVEVVRCKDCKHWFDNGTDYGSCYQDALVRHRGFFCLLGERREDDV